MSTLSWQLFAAALAVYFLAPGAGRALRALTPRARVRRRYQAARLAALRAPGGWLVWRTARGEHRREHYPNRLALLQRAAVLRALGTAFRVIPDPHSAIRPGRAGRDGGRDA
jgi:hypothetical protein